ncbi:MAG: sugar O-acetyltransferase precursor [Bacteroidetes bacterium]|jgi:hypothetical protein|nr:sugar O-acetyltransferase precursor [Bacteroidota bacterium]
MNTVKQSPYLFILVGILIFLFVPIIQNQIHFKKYIKPLKGAYIEAPDTVITMNTWLNGSYQEIKDKHLTQNFGLRNYYVRLNNQLDYKLFKIANVDKVIIGKGDFLYETNYIESYYGNNYIGTTELINRFKKIKELQDKLASNGIDLEIVFTPSKASFYPEFIPDTWISQKKVSNYECAAALCKKLSINCIDFSKWFRDQKNISPYDLYPKTGIHWSNYGALIATDSLKRHIEHMTHFNLRDFVIKNIAFSDSLISPDDDMGEAMNLLSPVKKLPMPYANYYWKEDQSAIKPRALFIGDSYFWNIYYQGLTNNLFTDCKFWYYNQTVYPESEPIRDVNQLNISEEIKKQQVIVLMATETNIHDIGWGFVDKALAGLETKNTNSPRQNIYVKNIKERIFLTPEWMKEIKKKAKIRNVSVDEMITLDAIYIYETEYCKPEVVAAIENTISRIKNTKEWMDQIKTKAKANNVTEAEMIELDAKYIYDTELKGK